jgi:hypothetical protein
MRFINSNECDIDTVRAMIAEGLRQTIACELGTGAAAERIQHRSVQSSEHADIGVDAVRLGTTATRPRCNGDTAALRR